MNDIADEDDEFDPMTKDYNDPKFNSYKSGPGSFINPSLHTQKGWEGKGQTFKLFVSSIPLGIKISGFQNIFSNFGDPLNTYLAIAKSNNCKFGFVEYRTLVEAQRAIYSVNNVPPLNLTVKFALTEEAKVNRNEHKFDNPLTTLQELSQPKLKPNENVKETGRGRGQLLVAFKGLKPKEMVSTYSWHTPYTSPYSEPLQSHPLGEFNIYVGDEILDAYHDAITYVKPVVAKNQRHVFHMGKGYNFKNILKYTDRYFPNEKELSYSNEEEIVKYGSKACCFCSQQAMRVCFNCHSWYCSKICFRNDSPNHIVNTSGMVLCYNVHDVEKSETNSKENLFLPKNKPSSNRGVYVKKLIFPPLNYGTEDLTDKSAGEENEKPIHVIGNRNSHLDKSHYLRNSTHVKHGENESLMNVTDNAATGKISDAESNLPVPEDSAIPPNSYTAVKISLSVGKRCYWVNKMSDSNTLFNITKSLFRYCESFKATPLSDVQPCTLCAAFVDGYWYRARIKSCNSDSVNVNLIDVGRDETFPLNGLKTLPQDQFNLPPLAFKIIFADGTPFKYESLTESEEISVKPIAVDSEGALIVQAENENYLENSFRNLPGTSTPLRSDVSINQSSANNVTISSEEGHPLPSNTYTTVIVGHVVSRSEYYVTLRSLWEELQEISEILNVIGKKKQPISEPVLDEIYIKSYEDYWCRAKVVCLDPMRVFYIDYGNEEEIILNNKDLRALPSSLSTHRFPPMAFKIKMADRTSDEFLYTLKPSVECRIKPVSKEGETYIVEVEGDDYSSESNSSTDLLSETNINKSINKEELTHLLSALEICKRFELTVSQVMSKDRVCGSLNLNPSFSHLTQVDIENQICNSYNLLNPQQVETGDMVACLTREGVCARGYVDSVISETRRVALVDLGYVSIADKLCQVPPSLLQVPEAAVSCTFLQPHNNIQVGCKLRCQNAKFVGKEIHCEIKDYGRCVLSKWKPRIEDGGLPCINIQSGSRVTISSYHSPQVCYVQSSEPKLKQQLDTLLQDVATYACNAPILGREPEMGEVVACLFPEDQNFYRAQVYRRIGKLFSVVFLDFGHSYDVSPSDMRILCDSLKMVPCCAVKVGLKEINENIFTAEALHFLNLKCADTETFYLEFEDSLKNAVLKTCDGLSLNKLIHDMVNPNWKKCLEEGVDPTNGEVFFGEDMKYLEWDIKSQMKLIIVNQVSDNCYIVINSQDGLLDFIRDWFTPRISEYCSSFDEEYQYNPRNRELCFVKMQDDDKWYRAVCVNVYEISCWVILVDFGNYGEVYFKNVRPVPFEFLQVPSILKQCIISGVPDKLPNEDAMKKLPEILATGSLHDAFILEDGGKGMVTAYFDKVAQIAQEIGLPAIKKPC